MPSSEIDGKYAERDLLELAVFNAPMCFEVFKCLSIWVLPPAAILNLEEHLEKSSTDFIVFL